MTQQIEVELVQSRSSLEPRTKPRLTKTLIELWLDPKPSERTRHEYQADLEIFQHFVGFDSVESLAKEFREKGRIYARELIVSWRSTMLNEGLSPATCNRRVSAVLSFVDCLDQLGIVDWDLKIKGLKTIPYRDCTGISVEDFDKIMSAASGDSSKAVRDRTLLGLLWLGLRREEIVQLSYPADVDLASNTILILGKGRLQKERRKLSNKAANVLKLYLDRRGHQAGPLFYNAARNAEPYARLTGSGLNRMVKSRGLQAGIDGVHCHSFRHGVATEGSAMKQIDINELRLFMRHSSLNTTQIYIDRRETLTGKVENLIANATKGSWT